MNIKDNYHNFNHKKVIKSLEGEITYVGDINYKDNVWAVYNNKTPNKKKNHKPYVLLTILPNIELLYLKDKVNLKSQNNVCIIGMDDKEIKKYAKISALVCLKCNTLIQSVATHDSNSCGCSNRAFLDGGDDYIHISAKDQTLIEIGQYNILSKKFTKHKVKK